MTETFEALKGTLDGSGEEESHGERAERLGVSETAVRVAVHRLRQRYRESLRFEVAQTLTEEETVEDEIRGLPDPYRNVTELRYLQDRTYLEIVEELNVPVGTVKTWLFRARQQLKDRLDERDVMAM